MTWPLVDLGDVCEFKYGKSLLAGRRDGGKHAVYGSNGIVGFHSTALSNGPTIVVGRKGSFGEVTYSPDSCWPIDTTYYIDSSATKTDLKWLSYCLRELGLTGLNRAAAIPGLNREDAYRQRLLLPPLDEQRRIAAILDHAASLRAKRQDVLQHQRDLPRAVFTETFGRWNGPFATIAEVALPEKGSIRTGPFGSQLLHSEFVDQGIAVLGLDNVVGNEFTWRERRYITGEKYDDLRRYTVRPGDVLMSIMGTCGRCVVVPSDIETAINTKHICAVTVDPQKALPRFVRAAFLWHPTTRQFLAQMTKGSVMDGLNMGIIKATPIPLPNRAAQQAFVDRAKLIEKCTRVSADLQTKSDELFASIQARVFRGEP